VHQRTQQQPPDHAHDTAGFVHIVFVVGVAILVLLVVGLVVNPLAVVLAGGAVFGLVLVAGGVFVAAHALRPRPPAAPLDATQLRRSLDDMVATGRTKLSPPTFAKVQSIRRTVLEILPRSEVLAEDVESLYLVEHTVLDYLPTALGSYYELPRDYATTEVLRDGKTAQELLLDQVTLLDDTMREIADSLNRSGSDRLAAHGRFLEDTVRQREQEFLAHGEFLEERLGRRKELQIESRDDGRPQAPWAPPPV